MTGEWERRGDEDWVVHTRRLRATPEEVWSALTEPARITLWAGDVHPYDGDGAHLVAFEAEDQQPATYRLDHCEPGWSVGLSLHDPGHPTQWRLELDLLRDRETTVLKIGQSIGSLALAPCVAAACEFYLDRLVSLVERRRVSALDLDEYFLARADHYRLLFPVGEPPAQRAS